MPLLGVGVAAQLATGWVPGDVGGFWLGCSLVAVAIFAVLNRHIVGMTAIAIGVWLNALAVALHGAMPVRADALVRSGHAPADLADLDLGGGRRFERVDDVAPLLGDVLPVAAVRAVVSIGDVIALVGVAVVAMELARFARRGNRWHALP